MPESSPAPAPAPAAEANPEVAPDPAAKPDRPETPRAKPPGKEEPKPAPAKPDPKAEALAAAKAAAEEDRRMIEAKSPEELTTLLGHQRFRIRELAGKRLKELLATTPDKVTDACYQAYTSQADPEIRMRAREVLLDHVVREQGGASRGFVGIGLMLHAFFDKDGKIQFAVKVSQVVPGTPAEKAGIKMGDLITSVDGVSLADKEGDQRFMDIVGNKGAGKQVTLKFTREEQGKQVDKTVELTLAPRPAMLGDSEKSIDEEQLLRDFLAKRAAAPVPPVVPPAAP